MRSRVLRSIWRLTNTHLTERTLSIAPKGYAILTGQPSRMVTHNLETSYYSTNATVKEKKHNLEQSLYKLQVDFSNHGNVHPVNFQRVLDSLEKEGALQEEQSLFLLEACADLMPSQSSADRMELFRTLWQHLKTRGLLSKKHYMKFLEVYAANGVPLDDFRKFLDESGLTDSSDMYEKLIEFACELGDVKLTAEIIAQMREKEFALTERVFNALIMGYSRNKDIKAALGVLETMRAAGVRVSSSTNAQLIGAYIENYDLQNAIEILEQHSGQFSANQIVRLVKSLSYITHSDSKKLMELLVKQLPDEFLKAKEVPFSIRNICRELLYNERIDEASKLIEALPCPKFNENQDIDTFGVSFLQDLIRSKVSQDKIIDIAKSLKDSGKNARALHIACDSVMRRNPEHAFVYLKALSEIEPLRPHYFWPLFLHRFRHNGEAGILNTLKMMTTVDVSCDYETLTFYVLPRLTVTLNYAHQAIKTLEDCGLKTSQMLTPIIAHLIFQLKLEEVTKLAQTYTSKLDTKQFIVPLANIAPSVRATRQYQNFSNAIHNLHVKSADPGLDFVGQVLLEIIKNNKLRNDSKMLSRIIIDLSRHGSQMSPAAVDIIGGHLGNLKSSNAPTETDIHKVLATMSDRQFMLPISENVGAHIAHPRDMSYEDLECHLVELEAKGMNTRGVLRRLLQVCIRDSRLERALEIKKKCDEAHVQMSPGMLASVFEMHIKLRDFPAAEASYRQLLKTFPGFLLDEHKLIDFAALTVQQGKLEDAKELLSSRAASRKIFGGDYVIKNVWNLLTSVAKHAAELSDLPKDKNLTKDFYFFIRKLGYCKSHNAVLGPVIREYIYRKDIRAAVAEFKKFAETFRHTPLQFELSSLLVRISNSTDTNDFNITPEEAKELLQQLTSVISSVHGAVNMNSSLLLAVAESGTENQLRKLLINPEFRINHDMLTQNCEHLNEEGSIQTLIKLAKACRGLGHVIKEQDVYDMLLMKFVSDNNFTASLNLFERLEADDELKMSQEFLKKLVNLLKVNKIEIPTSLALRAQVL